MTDLDFGQYPLETLARWAYTLNRYEWPRDFPSPEPSGWPGMASNQRASDPEFTAAWEALIVVAPYEACWTYWQIWTGKLKTLPDAAGAEKPQTWRDRPPLL